MAEFFYYSGKDANYFVTIDNEIELKLNAFAPCGAGLHPAADFQSAFGSRIGTRRPIENRLQDAILDAILPHIIRRYRPDWDPKDLDKVRATFRSRSKKDGHYVEGFRSRLRLP